jgi:hypothetical protein
LSLCLCLALSLFAAALLGATPALHEQLHNHAAARDHICAVTLFAAGHCAASLAPPIIIAPESFSFPENVVAPSSPRRSRGDLFLRLEHAPPALA